ncbi:MAG: hypothetical protein VX346_28790 [Planctomycetota bacterium]|nr:hypothetical protein [Planctomycetota bacterium]
MADIHDGVVVRPAGYYESCRTPVREEEFVFSLLVLGGISTTSATQASDKIDAQLALRHLLVRYFRVLDRRGER